MYDIIEGTRMIDVFVFGIGRSGTTMIYSLVQQIIARSRSTASR